jgi:hypothetical protein
MSYQCGLYCFEYQSFLAHHHVYQCSIYRGFRPLHFQKLDEFLLIEPFDLDLYDANDKYFKYLIVKSLQFVNLRRRLDGQITQAILGLDLLATLTPTSITVDFKIFKNAGSE